MISLYGNKDIVGSIKYQITYKASVLQFRKRLWFVTNAWSGTDRGRPYTHYYVFKNVDNVNT